MELVDHIQNQIEELYGIHIGFTASDYLINREDLLSLAPQFKDMLHPKELFLVNPRPASDDLEIALYLDHDVLGNLTRRNPLQALTNKNLQDFCTVIEGISHFVCYLHKAQLNAEITELELELQAEIDKFLLLAFHSQLRPASPHHLIKILFEGFSLHQNLTTTQEHRYQTANELARRFCHQLSDSLIQGPCQNVIQRARAFYPLHHQQKIQTIMN